MPPRPSIRFLSPPPQLRFHLPLCGSILSSCALEFLSPPPSPEIPQSTPSLEPLFSFCVCSAPRFFLSHASAERASLHASPTLPLPTSPTPAHDSPVQPFFFIIDTPEILVAGLLKLSRLTLTGLDITRRFLLYSICIPLNK